jgi:L-histidine N-alpha-methyltransferase
MSSAANVVIHPSQFPDKVRSDLLESLRSRMVNHKFHYDSIKQTQKWLALHQAHSPSRTDKDCARMYDRSFAATVGKFVRRDVHLIGLGCGGGQKDTRLLRLLKESGRNISYTPSDVSTAMVLVARQTALTVLPANRCFPTVCDLNSEENLAEVFPRQDSEDVERLCTFFGMIPNFEPGIILPKLAQLIRPGDELLLSANLAPGPDYDEGVRRILPQYDNALTRDWLMTFLIDLGVDRNAGQLRFVIEDDETGLGLKRVTANFVFFHPVQIQVDSDVFEFLAGQSIRVFFSYRYTPELLRRTVSERGFRVETEWITASEEEGVFLLSLQ